MAWRVTIVFKSSARIDLIDDNEKSAHNLVGEITRGMRSGEDSLTIARNATIGGASLVLRNLDVAAAYVSGPEQ